MKCFDQVIRNSTGLPHVIGPFAQSHQACIKEEDEVFPQIDRGERAHTVDQDPEDYDDGAVVI